jgi:hypothetical protein
MKKLTDIGAAVAGMFSDREDAEIASQQRAMRAPEIAATRAQITLPMLASIAADEMPECMEIRRELLVAVAQLAMRALDTVQAAAERATGQAETQH